MVLERALLSLKTSEKEAEGSWTAPSEETDPLVSTLLTLPARGLGESCANGELKWSSQNTEAGAQAWMSSLEHATTCPLTLSTFSSVPSFVRFHIHLTWDGWMKARFSPSLASVCWHCVYIAASGMKVALPHHGYL